MQRSAPILRCLARVRSFSSSSKGWSVRPSVCRSAGLVKEAERCLGASLLNQPRLLYQLQKQPCRFYSAEDLPAHFKITLPALSPTMEVGTVVRWEKQPGDRLSEGDLLCEIETDKATMGFEAPEEGFLAKIFVEEGSKDVPVGRLLCIIAEEESGVEAFKDFEDLGIIESPPTPPAPVKESTPPQAAPAPSARPTPPPPTPPPAAPPTSASPPPPPIPRAPAPTQPAGAPQGRVFASPLARKLAAERGIDLRMVQGTGPGGRIVKADIDSYVPGAAMPAAVSAVPGAGFTDIPVDALRLEQANAALYSKQSIPHYYLMADIDVGAALRLQDTLNEMVSEENAITLNEFVIKAASLACLKIPDANSAWFGDKIRQYHNVDVNFAVASDFGTVTPVINATNTKGLEAIKQEVAYVTAMAQEGKMQAQTGTFSISNYGEFGVRGVAGIIPSPQACHLGVGAVQDRYVPDEDAEEGYRPASLLTVALVCDHRVVDGAVGAQWLQQFKRYMEQPASMLL